MTALSSTAPTTVALASITKGDNPRRYFDRRKHEDLVASIRLRGVLQPILLRPAPNDPDRFAIVAGERRYRAALEAFGDGGEIPAVVREMTDQEALEAAIDENDVRDDASETEQADAAVRHLAACNGDHAEAARRLGWSKGKLDRRLALANLSSMVKAALDDRRIKVGHAELLAAVPADKQDRALTTILGSGLDVAKTRELLMRVTQSLAAAAFDKGECTTCPFNSGTQRALFETHVDDGHCTNPGCFQLKTEAADAARVAAEATTSAAVDAAESDDVDAADDEDGSVASPQPAGLLGSLPVTPVTRQPSTPAAPARPGSSTTKSVVSAKSIASRTTDLREATWRKALARTLAAEAGKARSTILVAAMSGTLSQIKGSTLTARAALLVGPGFPDLSFSAKLLEIEALPEAQASNVLAAIGAAYAKDVASFAHVADLARAFAINLRDSWQVDKAFLDRFTKDELKFIAKECGLIAHIGDKAFAKLLAAKKVDLIGGMLNATGFDWSGRLPSAMTLDGTFGPPSLPAVDVTSEVAAMAA
ncbi:PRTRC system ParB family protein [Sphingomonas sp. TX0522]|uniref:PRTRC system ParB family protein n=1 Tax=Sphingomonas sp. TX0522 TaxID=2479205 RepID=UPI0018DF5969|nr:PRTRC system ParB family protein [Sphingomonas sp. TX0522]MBI0533000.1 PRTRC system ParB family protein [Sphingomonas sp. TX0522]